ncbi:MAG: SusD/RagB family nutrient-binding outer membrane lipoprotein [Tannerella sp.]|jgi:hypothetical protein|nr:SusD/RagB family nutrient-binding outer membrane lipoprotein [Tannerella sp.]
MKKTIINRFCLIGILLAGIGLFGCDHFEEVNTNTDTTTQVTPAMVATYLIKDLTNHDSESDHDFISKYTFWNESVSGLLAQCYNEIGRWDMNVSSLNNVEKMINLATEGGYRNSYTALGHVVRVYRFYEKTIQMGDIPYSEAMKGDEGIYYPKYDTQKEVFLGMLNELDEADKLFAEGIKFDGDIVYDGDPAQWRKAANVLQLRLLITLSKRVDDADLKVKERMQAIVNSRPLFTSNADNLQRVYSNKAGQKYPFNEENNNHILSSLSTTIVLDTLRLFGDRRLFYYAAPTVSAISQGLDVTDWNAYQGLNPLAVLSDIQVSVAAGNISLLNDRYFYLPEGEPVLQLSYSEMNFILAEAVVRGFISGDAKAYYETGVRAAMQFTAENTPDNPAYHHNMKITGDYIDDYLKGQEVAFASNPGKQINQIIMQKYLMNYMHSPYRMSYLEYRRTGYPALPINPETNRNIPSDKMPMRWMYPQNEYTYNGDNVKEAVARQYGGADDVNGIMWILKD